MKNVIIFITTTILLFIVSCKPIVQNYKHEDYFVYKIDSLNNYYIIYLQKNDSLYKIISEKEIVKKGQKIKTNQKYNFVLHSIWNKTTRVGESDVSLKHNNYVRCLTLNDSTKICLENSIYDLHYADNVKGLYIVNN
jgi:hypothetical protein